MNTRKIQNTGIVPSNSFLIHPATLKIIKQNDKDNKQKIHFKKDTKSNIYLIPSINFSSSEILNFYNITYITDLEEQLNQYGDFTKLRLLKLLLSKSSFNNLSKDSMPNIFNFLLKYYDISEATLNNKLSLLKNKTFDEIFTK